MVADGGPYGWTWVVMCDYEVMGSSGGQQAKADDVGEGPTHVSLPLARPPFSYSTARPHTPQSTELPACFPTSQASLQAGDSSWCAHNASHGWRVAQAW